MPVVLLLLAAAALFVLQALGAAIPLWVCFLPLVPVVLGLLAAAAVGLVALIVGLIASFKDN